MDRQLLYVHEIISFSITKSGNETLPYQVVLLPSDEGAESELNIENLIRDTYKKIRDLNFDPIPEDNTGTCKYCVYKHLCKLDVI